jgi:hypothetical protein
LTTCSILNELFLIPFENFSKMELQTALDYLPLVIEKDIRHIDYKRVCELATKYFAYYTGFGLDEMLQQVTSTETKEEFDQRKLLTKHITKSILNSTKIPFNKSLRKKPEYNKIDFITKNKEDAIKEINEYIETFNGTRSLDEFLEVLFIEFNYHDPNAWSIVEFETNDPLRKAQPYPFIATSDQVIDFKLNNGILDYVIVMLDIKYQEEGKEKDGKKYTLYAGNETIVIQNVSKEYVLQPNQESIIIKDERYLKEVFTVKAKTDPDLTPAAIRFGYLCDPKTQYRTFLSIFDCAMPYLEKTLKINSEFDQSNAMITFAQRYAYMPTCTHEGCNSGIMPDGSNCPSCNGTGMVQAHSGVQQIISLPMPRSKEEMLDLNGLLVYKTPPIELLTFQKDYINQLKIDIHTTIFNVDLISKSEVSTTATEQLLNRDNMNDTLLPFARHYSEVRTHHVYFIAVYTDNVKTVRENNKTQPDIIITHKFPYDFKLKTLNELMGDLKAAYDSKASIATISAIEDDINEILYYDRPDELKKIRTINKYNPFRGNTPDEVKLMISSNLVSKFDQVLYTNLFNIFAELERENQEPWFYDLDEKKIYDLVVKKVEERTATLNKEKPKEIQQINYGQ